MPILPDVVLSLKKLVQNLEASLGGAEQVMKAVQALTEEPKPNEAEPPANQARYWYEVVFRDARNFNEHVTQIRAVDPYHALRLLTKEYPDSVALEVYRTGSVQPVMGVEVREALDD